jgi:hypothetical protein
MPEDDISCIEASIAVAESILELMKERQIISFVRVCSHISGPIPDPSLVRKTIKICKSSGPDIKKNTLKHLSELYTHLAEMVSQESGIPVPASYHRHPRYKAVSSWDFILLHPLIFKWIIKHGYPAIISDKVIEDDLKSARAVPLRIETVRLRHCIARSLELAGYVKRSTRGHGWDNERCSRVVIMIELARYYDRLAGK